MTTTPTYWISGSYRFDYPVVNLEILATPDDGFRVDQIGNYKRTDVYDQTNTVSAFGDQHVLSQSLLYDGAVGFDIQTALLANGQIGKSYIAVPGLRGRGIQGYAVAVLGDQQVILSKAAVDCYTMFDTVGTSTGGLFLLWGQTSAKTGLNEIGLRSVSASGRPLSAVHVLSSAAGHEKTNAVMTQTANKTVVLGYDDGVAGASTVSFSYLRVTETGAYAGGGGVLGTHAVGAATAVQALAGGGFVAAWDDQTANHSTAQLFAADGSAIGGRLDIAGDLTGTVTALHDGGFVLGLTEDGSSVIQRFGADGAAIGDAVAGSGELATLADGRFVVANATSYVIYDPREAFIAGTSGNDVIYGRLDGGEIVGMQGDDTLTGSAAIDIIRGGDGDDKIQGLEGADQLFGSAGDDAIGGGRGNDSLDGGGGNDSLNGSYDDDTLFGGAGADTLRGGSGADVFRYENAGETGALVSTRDQIVDFEVRRDRIDVHLIDADRLHAGQQSFSFIGTQAFTGPAQIRYEVQGSDTIVQFELNGDGQADMTIALSGNIALNASNFILTDSGPSFPLLSHDAGQHVDWSATLHLA